MELESFLSLDLFSLTFKKILALFRGGGDRPHRPPIDPPLQHPWVQWGNWGSWRQGAEAMA